MSSAEETVRRLGDGMPTDSCWNWPLSVNVQTGYGQIRERGKTLSAHRVSYVAFVGPIPERLRVLHRCDNRRCFNPTHLFLGTQADNIRDMWNKGRQQDYSRQPRGDDHHKIAPRGEAQGRAKLTEEAVLAIRGSSASGADEARRYGVSETVISQVRLRKSWRHVA